MSRNQSQSLAIYPDLKDKTVLISGGATGIGRSLVEAYANQGAKTAFVDIDEGQGKQLKSDLLSQGYDVRSTPCDITNQERYQTVFNHVS